MPVTGRSGAAPESTTPHGRGGQVGRRLHSSAAVRHGRRLAANVLAAGRATITVGGKTYDVVEPEIIDAASAAPQLSPRRQRAFQRFGIDSFVKVKLAK